MVQNAIILFRETLEAALVVGIVLGYLKRTGQSRNSYLVYTAVGVGIGASVAGAIVFSLVAGGFSGKNEEVFEGVIMLAAAALLTTMIFWMMNQSQKAQEIEQRVESSLAESKKIGVFLIIFFGVLREGVESVLFLNAVRFSNGGLDLIGAILGILAAVVVAIVLFRGAVRIRTGTFFAVTNVVLVLFAAGLVAHGIHELQEAGIIPVVVEHVWDINPAVSADGSYPLLHEDGSIGSLLKGLLGYNGNPSLVEVVAYGVFVAAIVAAWRVLKGRSVRHE